MHLLRVADVARRDGALTGTLSEAGFFVVDAQPEPDLAAAAADAALAIIDLPTREAALAAVTALKAMGVTAIMTAERTQEYGEIARFGVEVIPLSAIQLKQHSSNVRITSGSRELDAMCGGGFFRDSVILISGATGTGKTLMATEFMAGGVARGERCLLFAFEESREQLYRSATGWGVDFEQMERDGQLRILCEYPETAGLEDHLIALKQAIEEFKPSRVAIDSLSALERVSTPKGYREFVIALTSYIKHQEMAGLLTATTPSLMGGSSVTEAHISTITDSIILLRYVEMYGEMRRGLTVLKMRGSTYDKDIREFTIDGTGMHIGLPFRQVTGILAGVPRHVSAPELDQLGKLFTE